MTQATRRMAAMVVILSATTLSWAQQKTNNDDFKKKMTGTILKHIQGKVKDKSDPVTEQKTIKEIAPEFEKLNEPLLNNTWKEMGTISKESESINTSLQKNFPYKPTKFDLLPLLEEVPAPITSLPQAGNTDVEAMYKPYIEKIESKQKELKDLAIKHNKMLDVYQQEGQVGIEKGYAKEIDKNAIVQQMGGAEKLMNMSEAERKAAAEKMKAELMKNPAMMTGNAGMNDLAKKMMTDKEFAKRYANMSEAEKAAETRKYMATDPKAIQASYNADERNKQLKKDQKEISDVKRSMSLDEMLGRTLKRMTDAGDRLAKLNATSTKTIDDMKKALSDWSKTTIDGIPMVELGEYGHDKDPYQMKCLRMTEKMANYSIAQHDVDFRAYAWKQFRNDCKYAILEFNAFIAEYDWNEGDKSQLFNGTYSEPKVAEAINSVYGLMLQLAGDSKAITSDARSAQRSFDGSFN